VIPLQSEMKKPEQFIKTFGVLNIGMTIVTSLILVMGFLGYLKYGDEVKGSLTLNLPEEEM
jgi:proton-coupled amino acid transporter